MLNMISIKPRRYPEICAETASGPAKATACSPPGILIGSSWPEKDGDVKVGCNTVQQSSYFAFVRGKKYNNRVVLSV